MLLCLSSLALPAAPPCPPSPEPVIRSKPFSARTRPAGEAETEPPPVYVSADEVRAIKGGFSEFIGNVELRRGKERFSADTITHDRESGTIDATGSVRLDSLLGDRYETGHLHMQVDTHEGYASESHYRIGANQARGDAARIEFSGPDRTILSDLRYTTCPVGQDDWYLKIGRLELDKAAELGTARHAWVTFQGVPIFYFPYLNFSIADERKSGFLFPRLGYDGSHGLTLSVPYYFNLAPNYDATLTPLWLAHRGLMWQGELRYLMETGQGRVAAESLSNDNLSDNRDRAAFSYSHRQAFDPRWGSRVEVRYVSDNNYLPEFGDQIGATSQTHLPQFAEAFYRGATWNFNARVAQYQTIDPSVAPADKPYARVPQLNLSAQPTGRNHDTRFHFDAEWVNFDRDVGTTGARASVSPGVSWPMIASHGFLTPRLGARYAAYHLNNAPDNSPSYSIATASLDGGLFFERELRVGDRPYIQTLEPRLFLVHIPHRNQDAMPNFDTALSDFSFANLFRENRFSGGDRVGDAEQATAAVTTRFLDNTSGQEKLRLSLGQIYYFEDRLVNLPAGTVERQRSDYAAEAVAWLANAWHVRGGVQWNSEDNRSERAGLYTQYQPARNKILNLGYRSVRDELTQSDIATEWPLSPYWSVRARSLYSLRDSRNVESYLGATYATCCWSFRVSANRHYSETRDSLNNLTDSRQTNSIHFQLELTGLSRGGAVDTPLKDGLFHAWRDPYGKTTVVDPLLP